MAGTALAQQPKTLMLHQWADGSDAAAIAKLGEMFTAAGGTWEQTAIAGHTANTLATNDDPLAVLAQVKDRVSMIHTNDIKRKGHFEPVLLGEGVSPIVEIYRMVRENGFDGWISVEEASKTGEEGFRKAIPYADQAWVKAGLPVATGSSA